ncbi:LptF/LptG family permease [Pelagibacterales bacterium SAG-MED15]|nr:LptF/LptG family permease [Pelagibacterales bacterium SAG-MED15]
MIKVYQRYLITSFIKTLLIVFSIFFSLVIILNIFEEVSYLKETDANLFFPFFLTLLNSPSVVYETFPFIFFISTQFLFIKLLDKEELDIFKKVSLSNIKIIYILSLFSFITSLLIVIIFYNLSSNLKFIYLDLKNKYSKDNKYLAVVTENGLWIKDEINNNINIINAERIDGNTLYEITINQFTGNYDNFNNILVDEANIENKNWILKNANYSSKNLGVENSKNTIFETNFDSEQISKLFSDLSSLNFIELNNLKSEYSKIGYSITNINIHFHKIISYPINLTIMTVFGCIIMLNIKRNNSKIFHLILGTLCSVIIYYINYFSGLLGENEKMPEFLAIWLPLMLISLFCLIGLVRINEK